MNRHLDQKLLYAGMEVACAWREESERGKFVTISAIRVAAVAACVGMMTEKAVVVVHPVTNDLIGGTCAIIGFVVGDEILDASCEIVG